MHSTNFSYHLSQDLTRSALSYYEIGKDVYFRSKNNPWFDFQPAIGNLSIAIELILKAIVAKKCPSVLFTNIPDELVIYLSNRDALPDSFNIDKYTGDLIGFNYKAIEFDKAISYFYIFYPEEKNRFKKFLSNLSKLRNQSVHGTIPNLRIYELNRLFYLATNLFLFIHEQKALSHFVFTTDTETDKYITLYEDEEILKVQKAIESAQARVKKGDIIRKHISTNDWNELIVKCPVCGSDAICFGETEHEYDGYDLYLTFNADSFKCISCGLELENYDELQLAGMDATYDRDSDYDKERWEDENYGNPYHPYY